MIICDFEIWEDDVPVISIAGNPDFELWEQDVPLADVGAALGEEQPDPDLTPVWPAYMPVPLITVMETARGMSERTMMETGRIRIRRRMLVPLETLDIEWNFTADQFVIFKDFFETVLENGSLSFYIEIFGISRKMNFLDANYQVAHSDSVFSVSAMLEYVNLSVL